MNRTDLSRKQVRGGEKTNKKVLATTIALMAVVIIASNINMALAATIRTDHQYAGGRTRINVPGKPDIRLSAERTWSSDYGLSDRIQIDMFTGGTPPFKEVVMWEDNPSHYAFSLGLGTDMEKHLVKRSQIGVYRIGKTSIVYWTIPLVVPATDSTPEVTLPSGLLVLRGYGESMSSQIPPPSHPTGWLPVGTMGWFYRIDTASYYNAEATLFCPGWHYFGPVAEDYNPTVVAERIWSWKLP
jgi:hypothetical protein